MKIITRRILLFGGAILLIIGIGHVTTSKEEPAPPVVAPPLLEPTISITPDVILQGDPALVTFEDVGTSTITSLMFNGAPFEVFLHDGALSALIGIHLKMKNGSYLLVATLNDGRTITEELRVGERKITQAPLGIPEKLGGNTPEGEKKVTTSLAKENAIIESVPTADEKLWGEDFQFPIANPVITDTYGYTRLTGKSTISHTGTDFRAVVGTPVFAMNDGVVAIAREFTVYGNAVIIDHGLGLQTLYMHLSAIDVKEGDVVERGAYIGASGQTGYAEGPHLHVSIKIQSISIDPMKFLALF